VGVDGIEAFYEQCVANASKARGLPVSRNWSSGMKTTERSSRPSLAVAQTCPVRGDVDASLDQHLRLARSAASAGAALVVFPELSLTGYELDLARDLAFTVDDRRLSSLAASATDLDITMIVGAPVRVGSSLHIGALIMAPGGTIELYTKRRLGAFSSDAAAQGAVPPAEATIFEPGELDPLVLVGGRTCALAICADIGDLAHPQRAAARGADTYLASMFVIPSNYDSDALRLAGYARRHAMVVTLANFGGASGGLAAGGRSAVWSATGELLVQLGPDGPAVGVVTETSRGWTASVLTDGQGRVVR
jgi:predicted amidohydrolase